MSKLIVPNKDIVIPNAPEVQGLLREDFETIERWLAQNVGGPGTRVGISGKPELSGDIVLFPGSGINLAQSGQNITISKVSDRARSFDCFATGVLSARVLQKYTAPSAVLTNIDAYFQTAAPVGVSNVSCANIHVFDQATASLVFPLSVSGQSEWHLGVTPGRFAGQTSKVGASNNGGAGVSLIGVEFTPTANGNVGSFDIALYGTVSSVAGQWIRIGFIPGFIDSVFPVPPVTVPLPDAAWVTDVSGNPAYVDVLITDFPLQSGTIGVLTNIALNAAVSLVGGSHYTLAWQMLNAGKTGSGALGGYAFGFVLSGNAVYAGNITGSNWVRDSGGAWQGPFGDDMIFDLYGVGTGLSMSGLVTVEVTMTGAPATPGTDLNVSLQM